MRSINPFVADLFMNDENAKVRAMSASTQRGFTLIEMMVASAVGLFIVATALIFVSHQTRLLEFTKNELDRDRSGRLALDLLTDDLRLAGLGVGYDGAGNFAGMMLGSFSVQGGASFSNTQAIQLNYGANTQGRVGNYTLSTNDIGIRFANGAWRSIAQYSGSSGQVCAGGGFQSGDVVLLVADDAFTARTVRLSTINTNAACVVGSCVSGCDTFSFTSDPSYVSSLNAQTASYVGGEMAGGYKTIVWFVDTTGADPGSGNLMRAEVSAAKPCTARNSSCGQVVAYDVEMVSMSIYQWDQTTSTWVNQTTSQALTDRRRVRLDLEMVARTRTSETRQQDPIALQINAGTCVPGPCGAQDQIARKVLRTSVEVRNAGRMNLQQLAR
jgi:prepilin-type N-terminal cleavage/methylation domain-containing protein